MYDNVCFDCMLQINTFHLKPFTMKVHMPQFSTTFTAIQCYFKRFDPLQGLHSLLKYK